MHFPPDSVATKGRNHRVAEPPYDLIDCIADFVQRHTRAHLLDGFHHCGVGGVCQSLRKPFGFAHMKHAAMVPVVIVFAHHDVDIQAVASF